MNEKRVLFHTLCVPLQLLLLPEVAKIPPTMPHRRTRKPQNDRRRFSTRTMMDDKSYLKKIPKNQTKNERKIMKFLKWILFRSEYKQLHVSVGVTRWHL